MDHNALRFPGSACGGLSSMVAAGTGDVASACAGTLMNRVAESAAISIPETFLLLVALESWRLAVFAASKLRDECVPLKRLPML